MSISIQDDLLTVPTGGGARTRHGALIASARDEDDEEDEDELDDDSDDDEDDGIAA